MNDKEKQLRTQAKADKVKTLCKELGITMSAEEIVTDNGMIKKVIFYQDHEIYPEDKK